MSSKSNLIGRSVSWKADLEKFEAEHPWPSQVGVRSLFRFQSVNPDRKHFLEHLFVDGKLYHATADQLNDPFECKPHFNWPSDPVEIREMRKHLRGLLKSRGLPHKQAEAEVSKLMSNPGVIHSSIAESALHTFARARMCSFTTSNKNLLFWSHYARSHEGFCVEFDATTLPISYAFKVRYVDQYPEIKYPSPGDKRGLRPLLLKSKDWEYENEFRTVFYPSANIGPDNDGISLILSGHEIKSVYFGAKMDSDDKELIVRFIDEGPFNPDFWNAKLSKTSYSLDFERYLA